MTSYDWLKQIPASFLTLDAKPLFGAAPAFPWDALANEINQIYQLQNLKISPSDMQWREDPLAGVGAQPIVLQIACAPMEGDFYWLMAKNDCETLMELLLTKKAAAFDVLDSDFTTGFYQFIAAQTLQLLNQLEWDKNLSFSIRDPSVLPKGPAFCIDVSIQAQDKRIPGRAVLPPALLQAWRERFADRKLAIDPHSPLVAKLQAIVHLEAGKTTLSKEEWSQVKPGDFLLLDHCSLDLDSDKGRVLLTVHGHPLFRAKLKQGSLKILEYPLTLEAEAPMNDQEEEEEEFEDFEGETELEGLLDEEQEAPKENDAPPKTEAKPEAKQAAKKITPTQVAPEAGGGKTQFDAASMPITIHLEVGRLQMSLQQLMELQPGNLLELNIRPEDGVDLVVGGKRIAKGELLRIGEALGVRVLDIG